MRTSPPSVPQAGEISSFSFADNVGRIRLADGTEVRFGATALHGPGRYDAQLVAAVGLHVTVQAVAPHPLGGFKATTVVLAETGETSYQAAEAAFIAAHAAEGDAKWAKARNAHRAMEDVRPEPLTTEQERWFAQRSAESAARSAMEEAEEIALRDAHARKAGPGVRSWTSLLRHAGVPRAEAVRILELARPAARLIASPAKRAVARGSSKFGGAPDLPPGFVWPLHGGRPLAFVAQLRISELPSDVRTSLAFPPDGLLSFFYDIEDQPWGHDPAADRGGAVMILSRELDRLAVVVAPEGVDEEWHMREMSVRVVEELSLPALGTPSLEALALGEATTEAYRVALEAFEDMTEIPNHLVGGHAMPIQDAMEEDCALNMRGIATDEIVDRSKPDIAAILPTAASLRLVLQLDTDGLMPVMWGDLGRLYVWMQEADLRAQAFDRTWCLLQCS